MNPYADTDVAMPRRVHRGGDGMRWDGRSALDTDRQCARYAELCGPVTVTRKETRPMPTEADRLAAIDALIDAHACDKNPDTCPECDRLWSLRADAHA